MTGVVFHEIETLPLESQIYCWHLFRTLVIGMLAVIVIARFGGE